MHTILINSAEILLKGKNRSRFEHTLRENINKSLSLHRISIEETYKDGATLVYRIKNTYDTSMIKEALRNVFGVSTYFFADTVAVDEKALFDQIDALISTLAAKTPTLRIATKRSNKNFPLTSPEINKKIGAIAHNKGMKVDYQNGAASLVVVVGNKHIYIATEKYTGFGGLPVGVSGKVLVLLSGGIDSPVASWLLAKRGAQCDFLHIHNLKDNNSVLNSKIIETIQTLNNFQFSAKLYTAPYTPFDLAVMGKVPQRYELVVFKHYLLKLAERLAEKYGYLAIANGDSLAQVASQTLENINAAQQNISLPVFRPLIGLNKEEIIAHSKTANLYETAIQQYKDCCSLVAKNPATKVRKDDLEKHLNKIDIERVVEETLKNLSVFTFDK